jgi:hypothetical protein
MMAGKSDRRVARLIAEAQGSVRILYDRETKRGEIPSNLRHYLDDKETYQLSQRRGSRAIVRVNEVQASA